MLSLLKLLLNYFLIVYEKGLLQSTFFFTSRYVSAVVNIVHIAQGGGGGNAGLGNCRNSLTSITLWSFAGRCDVCRTVSSYISELTF